MTEPGRESQEALAGFVDELRRLRQLCGAPSLNTLVAVSASLRQPLARSTLSDKLNAKSLPEWPFVVSFVNACVAHATGPASVRRPIWRSSATGTRHTGGYSGPPTTPARPLTLDPLSKMESHELLSARLGPDRVENERDAADQIVGGGGVAAGAGDRGGTGRHASGPQPRQARQ